MTAPRPRPLLHLALWLATAFLTLGAAEAANCLSNASGNWNAPGTWTGCAGGNGTPANTPGTNDTATVRNGHNVTLTAAASALQVSITSAAGNNTTSQLTVAAQTLNVGANGLSISGGAGNRVALLSLSTGTVTVTGNVTFAGTAANARLTFTGAGTLNVGGNFPNGGTFAAGTGTVVFNTGANGTMGSYTYNNVTVSKTGAGAVTTTTGTVAVNGALNVSGGTLSVADTTFGVTGVTTVGSTLDITSTTGTKTFGGAVTVNGAWSNTAGEDVSLGAGLTNNGTFGAGNGAHTLTGSLSNTGTFNAGTGNFSLTGNFTNDGTFSASTGTFTFNGGATQTLSGASGATTFNNLVLNNAAGFSIGGTHDITVNSVLTLTAGAVAAGSNVVHVTNSAAGGIVRTNGFVDGNLRWNIPTGGTVTRTFPVGTGTTYSPVDLTFTTVSAAGNVTVRANAGDHPDVATSGIDNALSVNRYWTLSNSGVAFASYSATLHWVAGDVDAGADTSLFEAQRFLAGTWNSTTTGARTATSIEVTGLGAVGDFAVGQPLAAVGGMGRFNAFDTTTAAGAVTGFITTKIASPPSFSVAIVALRNNRKDVDSGFTGAVQVELLNASDNSGTLDTSTACNSSWTVIQTFSTTFVGGDNGRKNVAITEANVWREARLRMTSGGLVGCSTDAFAIRPASFTVTVTDATWDTAGAGRTLDTTGGVVHKAGQPFRITVTPSPASANYDGSPTVGALACTPASCNNGTLTLGAFAGGGTRTSDTATYSEAGAFNLTLEDRIFAIIDATDGTPADCSGRWVCQAGAPQAVGRFVPDRFEFASPVIPMLQSFGTGTCGFTYVGQPFWYNSLMLPSATLNAVNAAGAVTTNYALNLGLSKPAITETYADGTAPAGAPLDSSGKLTAQLTAGSGTGTYTASATGTLRYSRDTTTPVGPFNAAITLTVTASDATEAAVPGNGTITTPSPLVFNGSGGGIAFNPAAEIRYGRLRLTNASGSQLTPLLIRMEAQYYRGAPSNSFETNVADTCTAITGANISLGGYTANLTDTPTCETAVTGGGAFASGRQTLLLAAPGTGNNGNVTLTANLGAASVGNTCTAVGAAPVAATAVNQTYLQGNWTAPTYTQNPTARAAFGVYRGSEEVIFIRENF